MVVYSYKSAPTVSSLWEDGRRVLGSYDVITDANGNVVERLSFDAWGNRRNPMDWREKEAPGTTHLFTRGFTGHEHLDKYGIINMNGRLYDPTIGRFFSPDPFVQASTSTQGFNRYSYCLNNPLMYTDPSGEFFQFAILGLGTFTQGIENMLNGVKDPWGSAYKDVTESMDRASNAGQFTVYQNDNFSLRLGVDFLAPGISATATYATENTAISISVGYGFGGPYVSGGASQKVGDFTIGGGIGYGNNYWGWNAMANYKGYGLGYGQTYYGNAIGPDEISNAQTVGSGTILWKGGSFTLQNDFLAKSGDKWRTQAAELQIGNFVIGSSMYTNDGETASGGKEGYNHNVGSKIWGKHISALFGAWNDGRVYSSPLWIGIKKGNTVSRIGYSHDIFQAFQQNGMHTLPKPLNFGRQNYYTNYNYFNYGLYSYSGYYNPFSLW